ncbi:hypothetical protein OH76DRAFT_1083736 [Lentinus brumalis]|uniref:Secreted protein n=1 Tax=Lentinus brumalis TaxID=2498619 RepID=A0A371DPB0_9APHY|nr:hypothetical protein OH76DRAFT_1083736 [Polyporus brumalis]
MRHETREFSGAKCLAMLCLLVKAEATTGAAALSSSKESRTGYSLSAYPALRRVRGRLRAAAVSERKSRKKMWNAKKSSHI